MARLVVEAPDGLIAGNPGEVVERLADIAEADGADREEWLSKAMMHVGSEVVRGDPRYRMIEEVVADAAVVLDTIRAAMIDEIVALLEDRADATQATP